MASDLTSVDPRAEILATFKADRPLAHRVLFNHRHGNASPAFHDELIADWASDDVGVLQMVFRGGGKSTLAEEGIALGACFREFKHALLVGSSLDKACQRLHSIRYELETNTELSRLFGALEGRIWSVDQLELSNGVLIQAIGKGQSLRGFKHLAQRPDYLLIDDLEDRNDVRTEERMQASWQWLMFDLLPAMAQGEYRARMLATPMHPDAVPMRLEREGEWRVRKVPIYYQDEEGQRRSSWPDRFPLTIAEAIARRVGVQKAIERGELRADTPVPRKEDSIEFIENRSALGGHMRDFNCEYLVSAESPLEKPFKREMIRIAPQFLGWAPVNVMFDPARTTNVKSARTGYAAWSWIGSRLVVWESWGKYLAPDQIIEAIFQAGGCEPSPGYERMCGPFDCLVHLGVEEDGLNQWLLQPVRKGQVERGITLPLRALKAPVGKLDFIKSLQPYFNAREVEFAQSMPDLESELLSFPHGSKRDVPNALAYALKMRMGRPIYADFTAAHVAEELEPNQDAPAWLAMNATRAITTAALMQVVEGGLRIYADWVTEGDPVEQARNVLDSARLAYRGHSLTLVAPPQHFDRYSNVGLAAAVKPAALEKGTDPAEHAKGRDHIRDLLTRQIRGLPALMVAGKARWTAAAFSGGYAHVELKHGALAEYAHEGVYRTLTEGIESLAGLVRRGQVAEEDDRPYNAETPSGVPYRSMIGVQGGRRLRRG